MRTKLKNTTQDRQRRYGIRKLTVGTVSILLGTFLAGHGHHHVVHASVVDNKIRTHVAQLTKDTEDADNSKTEAAITEQAATPTTSAKTTNTVSASDLETASSSADTASLEESKAVVKSNTQDDTPTETTQVSSTNKTTSTQQSQEATNQTASADASVDAENASNEQATQTTTQAKSTKANNETTAQSKSSTSKGDTWKMDDVNSKVFDNVEVDKVDTTNFTLTVDGKKLDTTGIDGTSFQWVDKDGNTTGESPKNVGTYYARLTNEAIETLKKNNPTLTDNNINKINNFIFDIEQDQATASLRGIDSIASNDLKDAAPTLDPNRIYVDISMPNQTEKKYQLGSGDYNWYTDENDNSAIVEAPNEVGTYYLKLTSTGIDNVQKEIDKNVGTGTDKTGNKVSNVKVNLSDTLATYYVYDSSKYYKPDNLPEGTIWTPAGWTRSNPDYVAKSTDVTLYNSDDKGIDRNMSLSPKNANFTYTAFGTDIDSIVVDKEDMQVGNKILLATITATNDYAQTADQQLPLSVTSSENGRPVKDKAGTTLGFIEVNTFDNGEIDIWLNVTHTDTYADDVELTGFKDSQTGYITYKNDFSKLSTLKNKDGQPLKVGSTLTQTISTIDHTYQQKYVANSIGKGINNITEKPTFWQSTASPIFSFNTVNLALDLTDIKADSIGPTIQNINKLNSSNPIKPQNYFKVFLIQGNNINFDNLTTFERVEISPVDDNVKCESSDVYTDDNGNTTLLDKNQKQAIKLDDNLSISDLLSQTPDGQSAYSLQTNGGALVAIKVNPDETELTKDEIDNVVKHSQYYNLQAKIQDTINKTENFYSKISNQPIRTAIMIKADLKDKANNSGWGIIHDVTPDNKDKASDKGAITYVHGKTHGNPPVFRTFNIVYKNKDDKIISTEPQTVIVYDDKSNYNFSVTKQTGYSLNKVQDEKGNEIAINESQFEKTISKDNSKNTDVIVYLDKNTATPLTYTVIDTDGKDSKGNKTEVTLTENTGLGVYITNKGFNDTEDPDNSSEAAANTKLNKVISRLEKQGYILADNPISDWNNLKDYGYNVTIKVKHGTTEVKPGDKWPDGVSDDQKYNLTKDVTRKIIVHGLPGLNKDTTQVVTFNTTATVDNVTKQVILSNWNSKDNWNEYNLNPHEGFVVDTVKVDGKEITESNWNSILQNNVVLPQQVTANSSDSIIEINYKDIRSTVAFQFVDDDNREANVGTAITKKGNIRGTVSTGLKAKLPDHYVFVNESAVPEDYEFQSANDGTIKIHLQHKHQTVNPGGDIPEGTKVTVDGKDQDLTQDDLVSIPTRIINVKKPGETDYSQVADQSTKFTRTADVDLVTKEATFNDWQPDGTTEWPAYTAESIPGYDTVIDPKGSDLDAVTTTATTPSETINISYNAQSHTSTITFKDSDDKIIGTPVEVTGDTDTTQSVTATVPAGWKLSDGQSIPENIPFTYGEDGQPNFKDNYDVTVEHNTITLNPDQVKTGKLPEDTVTSGTYPTPGEVPAGAKDVTKNVTRTINVTKPGETKATQIVQNANFTRNVTIDLVDGSSTYGDWTGSDKWDAYTPEDIAGYTTVIDPENGNLGEVTPEANDSDVTVNVTYTANPQTVTINYVDTQDDNRVVATGSLSGVTDGTVDVPQSLPADLQDKYEVVGTIPGTYTFTDAANQTITVNLKHATETIDENNIPEGAKDPDGNVLTKTDFEKKEKRTVTAELPSGNEDLSQTTTLTRTATLDKVTNKVTEWGKWSTSSFNSVNVPQVPGYTAQIDGKDTGSTIPAEDSVTSDYEDPKIVITYKANDQKVNIKFIDTYNGAKTQVGDTITKDGTTDKNIKLGLTIPAGYKLADGQKLPTDYTFTPSDNQEIDINLTHVIDSITKVPDGGGSDQDGTTPLTDKDFSQTLTRTITAKTPHDEDKDLSQSTTIDRSAQYDEATKKVVSWSNWSTDHFDAVNAPEVAGYTPSKSNVEATDVANGYNDPKIVITYNPNSQSITYNFKDLDDKDNNIPSQTVNGVTDQTVNPSDTVKVPDNYVLVDQNGNEITDPTTVISTSYKFKPSDNEPVTVYLKHAKETIDKGSIPEGAKDPDGNPLGSTNFEKTEKRTITADLPSGNEDLSQTTTLTRTATLDKVTNKVISWSDWSTTHLDAVNAPEVAGYAPSQANVTAIDVTDGYQDPNIVITYKANNQKVNIKFVDTYNNANTQVGNIITKGGKTDQTIQLDLTIPIGYRLADGQNLSTNYTFTSNKDQNLTINLTHNIIDVDDVPETDSKNINDDKLLDTDFKEAVTRTIHIYVPTYDANSTYTGLKDVPNLQSVTLTRTGQYDQVTKKIVSWNKWSTGTFEKYVAPENIAGYEADSSVISEQAYDGFTDSEPVIKYVPIEQTIIYNFIDDDNNHVNVGTKAVEGYTDGIYDTKLTVPDNFVLVEGSELPKTVTLSVNHPNSADIHVKHKLEGTTEDKNVSRKIIINFPNSLQTDAIQTTQLSRTRTKDLVTGKITTGGWSTDSWKAFDIPEITGYTASASSIPAQKVGSNTVDTTVTINYTANPQEVHYQFIDLDNNNQQIGNDIILNGVTDETKAISFALPENYQLADNEKLPESYKFKATDNDTILINLKHKTQSVSRSKNINQTIHYQYENGNKALDDYTTTKTLTDKGTKDLVTGKTTWNNQWSTDSFVEVDTPKIDGYTANNDKIAAQDINGESQDIATTVVYAPDDQSITYSFVDDDNNGSVVGKKVTVSGKTDEVANIDLTVPENYVLSKENQLPTEYKFKASDNNEITIHVLHTTTPQTSEQTVTRKITYRGTKDGGKTYQDIDELPTQKQSVTFHRTEIIDNVTHKSLGYDINGDGIADTNAGDGWMVNDQLANEYELEQVNPAAADEVGYTTVDTDTVSSQKVKPTDENPADIVVTYNYYVPSEIRFYDDTDNVELTNSRVSTDKIGVIGDKINLDITDSIRNLKNQGYTLVRNGFEESDKTYHDGENKFEVHLIHKQTEQTPEPSQHHRTINYYDGETGESLAEIAPSVTQTITYQRTPVKDEVTGKIIGYIKNGADKLVTDPNEAWELTDGHYAAIDSPNLTVLGYKEIPSFQLGEDNGDAATAPLAQANASKDAEDVNIYYFHNTREEVERKTVQRHIYYWDGTTNTRLDDAATPVTQTEEYQRTKIYDAVTGEFLGYQGRPRLHHNSFILVTDPSQDRTWVPTDEFASFQEVTSPDLTGLGYKSEMKFADDTNAEKAAHEIISYDENGDPVDADDVNIYYFHDSESVNESATVTHTIDFKYVNGPREGRDAGDNLAKTITYTRNGARDKVTGEVIYENDGQWTADDYFGDVTSPTHHGYHADQYFVKAPVVDASALKDGDSKIQKTHVKYYAEEQKMTIDYIDDDTHQILKTDQKEGYGNSESGYSTADSIKDYEGQGYILVDDATSKLPDRANLKFDNDTTVDQHFEVRLKHVANTNDDNPSIVYDNNQNNQDDVVIVKPQNIVPLPETPVQSKNADTDLQVEPVHDEHVDKIHQESVQKQESIKANSSQKSETVSQKQQHKDTIAPVKEDKITTSTGNETLVKPNAINKQQDISNKSNANNQAKTVAPFADEKLPQTSEKDSKATSVIGLAAIALGGLLGLAGTKRKKKKNN